MKRAAPPKGDNFTLVTYGLVAQTVESVAACFYRIDAIKAAERLARAEAVTPIAKAGEAG